jgi:hypothetical protein
MRTQNGKQPRRPALDQQRRSRALALRSTSESHACCSRRSRLPPCPGVTKTSRSRSCVGRRTRRRWRGGGEAVRQGLGLAEAARGGGADGGREGRRGGQRRLDRVCHTGKMVLSHLCLASSNHMAPRGPIGGAKTRPAPNPSARGPSHSHRQAGPNDGGAHQQPQAGRTRPLHGFI